jgi:hypothetical protein
MLRWDHVGFHKKCTVTCYAELVFLRPVGSAGYVVHSCASGARNIDALFFMLSVGPVRNPQTACQEMLHRTCFDGYSDSRAYIEWELKVEKEFDEHDHSEAQMIYIASHALAENALLEWKHICRHNNIPQY